MPKTVPPAADLPPGHEFFAAASGLRSAGDSTKVGDYLVTRQTDYIPPPPREIEVTTHKAGSIHFFDCDHVVDPEKVVTFEGSAFQDDIYSAWQEWVTTKGWSEEMRRAVDATELFPFEFWEHVVKERIGMETVYVCPECGTYPTAATKDDIAKFEVTQYRCSECSSFYPEFSQAKECCA